MMGSYIADYLNAASGAERKEVFSAMGMVNDVRTYADYAAARTALGADKPIVLPGLGWGIGENNLYSYTGSLFNDALGPQYLVGDRAAPTDKAAPIIWSEKFSSADRAAPADHNWDQNIYAMIKKISGAAYAATITGAVRHEAGTGQMIGVHGRGEAFHSNSEVWGAWSYAIVKAGATSGAKSAIGHEVDIVNLGPDLGWMEDPAVGNTRGLICVTVDSSNPVTHLAYIGAGNTAPSGRAWTGLLIGGDSIVLPTEALTAIGNGEAFRIKGHGNQGDEGYGGIRLKSGKFRYGLSTSEASISNNAAIILGEGHRIIVGSGPANTTYLSLSRTSTYLNLQGLNLRMSGTKVLGTQQSALPANASDLATAITLVNAIKTGLSAASGHGLFA